MGPKTNHLVRIGDFSLGNETESTDDFRHVTQVEGVMGLKRGGLKVFLDLPVNLKGGSDKLAF